MMISFKLDTDSFIMHIKTEIFWIILKMIWKSSFDTCSYEFKRSLRIGKYNKVLDVTKDESYDVTCFVGLRLAL